MAKQSKKSLSEFSLCMTNINSLCPNGQKADLKIHTIVKQEADIHIIVDSRLDENGMKKWRKMQKKLSADIKFLEISQNTGGSQFLQKKYRGYYFQYLTHRCNPHSTI